MLFDNKTWLLMKCIFLSFSHIVKVADVVFDFTSQALQLLLQVKEVEQRLQFWPLMKSLWAELNLYQGKFEIWG